MIKLFLDMDGTIAKFNSKRNAIQRFTNEKGFFKSLKPFKYIEVIDNLIKNKSNNQLEIFIISASPNENADAEKREWLRAYLPSLSATNICFCRIGTNKAKAIKEQLNIDIDKDCYLLDDYTNNLIEWNNSNGIGIKRLTSKANNSRKIWKGLTIRSLKELQTMFC